MDLLLQPLTIATFFPLLGVLALLFIRAENKNALRWTALITSLVTFIISIWVLALFDASNPDLQLVARFCDRVMVMYRGKVMEELEAAHLDAARHPYTRGLLECLPKIGGTRGPLPVLDRDAAWAE